MSIEYQKDGDDSRKTSNARKKLMGPRRHIIVAYEKVEMRWVASMG
jgi:hypothetical protein